MYLILVFGILIFSIFIFVARSRLSYTFYVSYIS